MCTSVSGNWYSWSGFSIASLVIALCESVWNKEIRPTCTGRWGNLSLSQWWMVGPRDILHLPLTDGLVRGWDGKTQRWEELNEQKTFPKKNGNLYYGMCPGLCGAYSCQCQFGSNEAKIVKGRIWLLCFLTISSRHIKHSVRESFGWNINAAILFKKVLN